MKTDASKHQPSSLVGPHLEDMHFSYLADVFQFDHQGKDLLLCRWKLTWSPGSVCMYACIYVSM